MIIYQVCEEMKSGDFIIFDEFPTIEQAIAYGMNLKLLKGTQNVAVWTIEVLDDVDENILNIHKL